ncbi:MAG: class I SAM-dependent methyltransferase [Planctomycetota bacterium]
MPSRSNATESNPPRAADAFGAEYYRRFYSDPRTRVGDLAAVRKLATFVGGYVRYLGVPVRSILDAGCGVGHWQKAARTLWPHARYHGVEYSPHLCERFGWHEGSLADFDPARAIGQSEFDLVVCQGVLQYLDDRAAARALKNLGRWCRGALYLEALTKLDWQQNCDRTRTDGKVHLRPGPWYRQRLRQHFTAVGGGVFVSRRAGVTMFELEGPA